MLKRVLVPLDGSPLAETALAAATLLAKRCDAELILVRVDSGEARDSSTAPQRLVSHTEVEGYLDNIVYRLSEEGIPVQARLSLASPAEGIASQAALEQVDMVIMTTHGRTGLEALLHPSITWQVLTHTPAPILAWKSDEQEAAQQSLTRFMTDPTAPILIPLDGSLQAESALLLAQELARLFGNALVLVRAVEPVYYIGREASPETGNLVDKWRLAEAQSYLQHQRLELVCAGFQVEIATEQGPVTSLIKGWIQEYRAGLVVIASHGRGWLGRTMLGSVARSLLSHVTVPLLLIRRFPMQNSESS